MASIVGSSQSNSSSQTTNNNNSNSATNSNSSSDQKISSISTIATDTLGNATSNNALLTKVVENLNAVIQRSTNNQNVTKLLETVEKITSPNTVIESKLPEQLVLQHLLQKLKVLEMLRQADKQQNSNSIMMSSFEDFDEESDFVSNLEQLKLGNEILKKIPLPLDFDLIRAILNDENSDIDSIDRNVVKVAFIISTLEDKNFKEGFSFTADTTTFIQQLFNHIDLCLVMYELIDKEAILCSILSQLLRSDDDKLKKLYEKAKNEDPKYWKKASEMGEDLTFSAIAKISSKLPIPVFAAIVNGQVHNKTFIGAFFKDYFLKKTTEKQKEFCSSLNIEVFLVGASHIPFADKCKLSEEISELKFMVK